MITGTAGAIVALFAYMSTNFVAVDEFNQMSVEVFYGQYYDNLERIEAAQRAGNEQRVRELTQRNEKLRAKICKVEPEWERCQNRSDG